MAKLTAKEFLELVERSNLADPDQIAQTVDRIKQSHGGRLPDDPEALARALIEANLITRWHSDKLLDRKYKGFFLGKYKLLGHLGTGGMSSVYLAEHTTMHRRVAIKVLPKSRVHDSSYLARFYREAKAAAALDHANIVRAYDIDNDGDTHYLVMEYVEGKDLQQKVKQEGVLDFELAADFIAQAAEGLQHAHEAGLVHRDIKPANLLIDHRGTIKILDMGLARFNDDDKASLTIAHEENVLGTADYLSPEQAVNSHSVDARADIYSLGCSMYFLLTGHPPFPDGTLAQRINKHQTETPADIRLKRPDAPPVLVDICNKMMRKRPERRYSSASEVANELRQFMGGFASGSGKSGDKSAQGDASTSLPGGQRSARPGARRGSGSGPARQAQGARPARLTTLPPPRERTATRPEDTISDHGRPTVKGLPDSKTTRPRDSDVGGGSGRRSVRTARPLGSEEHDVTPPGGSHYDSGKLELGAEATSGEFTSLMEERRARMHRRNKTAPLWIWIVLGSLMLLAIVLMLIALMSGGEKQPDKGKTALLRASHLTATVPLGVDQRGS